MSSSYEEWAGAVERVRSKKFDGYISGRPGLAPVIFLHGWAGSKDIWIGFLQRCPSDLLFISLDVPGTGGSPGASDLHPDYLASWISGIASELGVSSFHLVGHSMGGNMAAWIASKSPSAVLSLTLVSPALGGSKIGAAKPFLSKAGKLALSLSCYGAGVLGMVDELHPHKHDGGTLRSWWRRYRYVTRDNTTRGLLQQLRYLTEFPLDLSNVPVSIPILIIHGTKDMTVSVDQSREAASARPQNTLLRIYESCMHCPMDEEQDIAFAEIERFVRSASGTCTDIV